MERTAKRKDGSPLILIIFCVFILSFVAGAASFFFKTYPYGPLRNAFLGAQALYTKYVVYRRDDINHKYLWTPSRREETGVTLYQPDRAFDGLTLYMSTHAQEAHLIDMSGETVHQWSLPFSEAWPQPSHIEDPVDGDFIYWRAAHVYPNGDLLMIYVGEGDTPYGYGLAKMDKDSNLIWTYSDRVHHDIAVGPQRAHLRLDPPGCHRTANPPSQDGNTLY